MMLVEMLYFSVFFHSKDPIIGPITSAIWIASENFLKIHSILIGRPSVGSYGLLSLLFASSVYMCSYILDMLV